MDLLQEKLFLLKSIASDDDELLVYDKDLEISIRKILIKAGKYLDSVEAERINLQLMGSLQQYRLGVVRALLTNLHLLSTIKDLRNLFEDIFNGVAVYCKEDENCYKKLLEELDPYSGSGLEVTKEFIVVLIEKLDLSTQQLKILLDDENYSDQFKLILFSINARAKKNIELLFDHYVHFATTKPCMPAYLDMLIAEFLKTSRDGFDHAKMKYLYMGNPLSETDMPFHGIKLMAAFGETLINWLFFDRGAGAAPLAKFVEPAIRAFKLARRSSNIAMKKLAGEWTGNPKVDDSFRKVIRFTKIADEGFFSPFDSATMQLISERVQLLPREIHLQRDIARLRELIGVRPSENRRVFRIFESNIYVDDLIFYCLMAPDISFSTSVFVAIRDWSVFVVTKREDQMYKQKSRQIVSAIRRLQEYDNFQRLPQKVRDELASIWPFKTQFTSYIKKKDENIEYRFERIALLCSLSIREKVRAAYKKPNTKQ